MEINDLLNIIYISTGRIWDVWKAHEGDPLTAKTIYDVSQEIGLSLAEPNQMLRDGLGIEIRVSVSSDPSSGTLIIDPRLHRSPIE